MGSSEKFWILIISTIFLVFPTINIAQTLPISSFSFGPFQSTDQSNFTLEQDASINNGALQITPDSINANFILQNKSGRVVLNTPFKLYEIKTKSSSSSSQTIASFNSTFTVNIYRPTPVPAGEGIAFFIAPDRDMPAGSHGQWLGLTNATVDGLASNRLIAIELDTVKQQFDPDGDHIGLDINSVVSNKTFSLSRVGIEIAPIIPANYTVWVQYNGLTMIMNIYMAREGALMPSTPLISSVIDVRDILSDTSYFGFSASTGNLTQLNCVLRWDLTVEKLPGDDERRWVTLVLAIGIPGVAVIVILVVGLGFYVRKRSDANDPNILGTLKSLPGTPREFSFKELKKATNNFDEKMKLGQGGFGIVYKGILVKEDKEVAVKKFSRENIKGKDDFLAELTIINRLRHKHLVKLVGWCHRNTMLLLVYDYMPNGSLDDHLFGGPEKILNWGRRYNIISGITSALHYLHNEYDQKVVHRDLKASNVLLDSEYNARLGDFGLARALDNEKTSYAELEGVPGTMGYIAPECFHTGKATRESDVYGFGAVVLEVVCGRRPRVDIAKFQFLVDWVWVLYREGRILEAVDSKLSGDYVAEDAERLLLLGLACSHPIASERPNTQTIVQIVSRSVKPPFVPPIRPAFVWPLMEVESSSAATTATTQAVTSSYYDSGWTPRYLSRESQGGAP
eukprot:TRINITY_DN433_c0_g1_i1.p1 TRINITY_DN433_c0_g1~~TRINITY_DN433_c0_g1_i1.p1  ORF type:complete len:720 (-),score=38.46 TRINITY_DN433_c0_g1_i1:107-2149(-)